MQQTSGTATVIVLCFEEGSFFHRTRSLDLSKGSTEEAVVIFLNRLASVGGSAVSY